MNIPVLDHGYVRLVEPWGSDERIIEAARMSTSRSFLGWGPSCKNCGQASPTELPCTTGIPHEFVPGDEKLLAYLWRNSHFTPFEMAGVIFEVKAPIFVMREWRTHRTAAQVADEYDIEDCFPGDSSYNELSARYAPIPNENYVPTLDRLLADSNGPNRQAGTIKNARPLTPDAAQHFQEQLVHHYQEAQSLYESALHDGIPKELARVHLPVGRYSKMRCCANLRNHLAFLRLRMDSHAQFEIQEYARAAAAIIASLFPRTWELFNQ